MRRRLSWLFVVGVFAFLFAPVAVVVLFSFNATSSTSLPFRGFSLRWYRAAYDDPLFRESLRNSIVVAAATAAFVVVVGVNTNRSMPDQVYLIVRHEDVPTTYKAVLSWRPRDRAHLNDLEAPGADQMR